MMAICFFRMVTTVPIVPLSNACRLCLGVQADNVNIFSEEAQKRSLVQKVCKHLSVWITKEDCFPKNICQHCITEVEHFSSFYAKVESVQNGILIATPQIPIESNEKPKPNNFEPGIRDELLCNMKVECNPVVEDDDVKESPVDVASAADIDYEQDIKPEEVHLQNVTVESLVEDIEVNARGSQGQDVPDVSSGNEAHCDRVSDHSPKIQREDNRRDDEDAFPEEITEQDDSCKNNPSKPKEPVYYDLAFFYKLSCEFCQNEKTFATYELLQKHCLVEHNTKAFVTCCNRRLSGKDVLRKHMRKHVNPFKCKLCDKKMSTQWTLNCHMLRKHTSVDKLHFKCRRCSKAFATKKCLEKHENCHIWKEERSGCVCDLCGKRYINPRSLHAHKFNQHTKQNVMCHICPRFFSTPSALGQHLRTHQPNNDSEPEQCNTCGKTLKNKVTMRIHMRVHDAATLHCPQCDKVYSNPASLKAHQLAHSDERPYKCHICSKSFKKKVVLKDHMNQHTGECPYQCPHCARTFASKANFYTHKRKMHTSRNPPKDIKPDINLNLYH